MKESIDYPDSYYYHTANNLKERSSLKGSHAADICVIGAGYTGLLTALNLSERGHDVTIVEANKLAWGASGRNGGQLGSGYNKKIHELEKDYGKSLANELWRLSEYGKSIVKTRIEKHEIDCDLKAGNATVSNDRGDDHHHKEYVEKLNTDYGYDLVRYMNPEEVREMFHSSYFDGGGSLDMGGAHLHPLNYALGLAQAQFRAVDGCDF